MRLFARFAMALTVAGTVSVACLADARADNQIILSNWGTGMYGAPWAVAFDKGYFKDAGIQIDGVIAGQGGGTSIRNLMASDLPFGEVASTAAYAAWKEGLPVAIVAATAYSFDNSWVVMQDSDVHTIHDLVHKKMTITNPASVTEAFLLMSLKASGIDANSVQRVAAGSYGQGLTLLEHKGADAAAIIEPLFTTRKDRYRIVFNVKDLLPPVLTVVCVVNRDYAKAHPDQIKAILTAHRRGVDDLYAHPEETGRIMAKAYNIDPAIGVESVAKMAAGHYWLPGNIPYEHLESMSDAMQLVGLASAKIDWHPIIDESYLPADLQSKK